MFLVIPTSYARASMVITEIMYDPSGSDDKHEWVEVYNNGSDSIDLTKYFLQTDGVGSSYHAINSVGTTTIVPAGAYAVIAQDAPTFTTDQTGFGGLLFDSSWSDLSDSVGKNIVINDANKVMLDQYTYDPSLGASNDGNSLQKNTDGVWVSAVPTPGISFADSSGGGTSVSSVDTSGGGTASVVSSTSTQSVSVVSTTPAAVLSVPKTAIAGVAVTISPSLIGMDSISVVNKSFHVTLGDGTEHYDSFANDFEHIYSYPGTYVINFEYIKNPYSQSKVGNLSVRKTIEVLSSPITIGTVGVDGSISISNSDTREVDISQWILRSISDPNIFFVFPEGTIILPGKKIIFSKDVTGFLSQNEKKFELSLPSGVATDVYDGGDTSSAVVSDTDTSHVVLANSTSSDIHTVADNVSPKKTSRSQKNHTAIVANYAETLSEKDVQTENTQLATTTGSVLPANAVIAIEDENKSSSQPFSFPYISIVGIIGVIVVSVYTLKSLFVSSEKNSTGKFTKENLSTKEIAASIRIIEE